MSSSLSISPSMDPLTEDVIDPSAGEEGIMVAIRMRPLNSRESAPDGNTKTNRVWRVLQKYNSITQCTPEGKPLPERINGRNFFTYDRTFGEVSTTRQVYDEVAKGIVSSVTSGLNGTIFAYGQTSSGKTYTMQGSGPLEDSSSLNNVGGIVHMAASDIFNHIKNDSDRVFLVRVSFIEIYNEEVRDLLVSGGEERTLSVREDPRRGVFVNSNETIVAELDSLLSVLFTGEKNRSVAATGMNERSSRSHTIFKITVESRLKREENKENESDDEDDDDADESGAADGNGAVRVSTLNLVDLAGSESVRHTGATGDRQKEGGKINQSLLTLSRVIGSLGQNASHVNFRDSKLTRILQPSLSGNARMAVICCATPSELYLEETRSTLQFASRAKLVKTRAKVNEVMDDRSLIKKLQKELLEARKAGGFQATMEQMKALEEKAANEGEAKRKAEQDLRRMKELILKGGVLPRNICFNGNGKVSLFKSLFLYDDKNELITSNRDTFSDTKRGKCKRRYSDGFIKDSYSSKGSLSPLRDYSNKIKDHKYSDSRTIFSSPKRGDKDISIKLPKTEMKLKRPNQHRQISPAIFNDTNDIELLRSALATKGSQVSALKSQMESMEEQLRFMEMRIPNEQREKEMLRLQKQDLESQVIFLASDKEFVLNEQEIIMAEKDSVITDSLKKIEMMLNERKEQAIIVADMNALIDGLRCQICQMEMANEKTQSECQFKVTTANTEVINLNEKITALTDRLSTVELQTSSMQAELDEKNNILSITSKNLDGALFELSNLTEVKHTLDAQVVKLECTVNECNKKLLEADEITISLNAEKSMMQEIITSSNMKVTQLTVDYATTSTEREKVKEQFEGQLLINQKDGKIIEELKTNNEMLLSTVEQLGKEVEQLQFEKHELDSQVTNWKVAAVENEDKIENLMKELNLSIANATQLEEEKNEYQCKLEQELTNNQKLFSELSSSEYSYKTAIVSNELTIKEQLQQITDLTSKLEHYNQNVIQLSIDLSSEKEANSSLVTQIELANVKVSQLQHELDCNILKIEESKVKMDNTNEALEKAEARISDLLNENLNTEQMLSRLQSEKIELDSKMEANMMKHANLQSEKEVLQDSVAKLEETVQELNRDLEKSNNEVDDLHSLLKISKEIEETLEFERMECARKMQQDNTENERLAHEISKKESEVEELNETIKVVTSTVSVLDSQLLSVSGERDKLSEELTKTMSELTVLQRESCDLRNKIAEIQLDLSKINSEHDMTESNVKELIMKNDQLMEEISTLKAEKDSLAVKLDECSIQLVSERNGSQSKMDFLNATVEDFQQKNDSLILELDASKSEIKTLNEIITMTNISVSGYNSQLLSVSEEKDKLSEELLKAMSEWKTLQQESSEQRSMIEKMQLDMSTLSTMHDSAKSKIEELLSQIDGSVNEILTLRSEKDAFTSKIEDCLVNLDHEKNRSQSTIDFLNATIEDFQRKNEDLILALDASKLEAKELSNTIVASSIEVSDIKSQLLSAGKERDKISTELLDAISERTILQQESFELRNKISELELNTETLNANYVAKESELKELILKNDRLTDEISILQAEKDVLVSRVDESQQENGDLMLQLDAAKSEIQALNKTIMISNIHASDINSQLLSIGNERDKVSLELHEALSELTQLQQKSSDFSNKVAELELRVSTLNSELVEKELTRSELISRNDESMKEISALQGERSALKSKVEECLSQLDSEKKESQSRIDSLNDDIVHLREKNENLILDLNGSKSEIQALNGTITMSSIHAFEINKQLLLAIEERDNAQKELQNVISELSIAQQNSFKQREKVVELESRFAALNAEHMESESKIKELILKDGRSMNEVFALKAENDALESKVEECSAQLDSEKTRLQHTIDHLNATLEDFQENNHDLKLQLAACARVPFITDSEMLDSLKQEISELKALLFSSNQSVEEARTAALEAERELDMKELKLEEAMRNVCEQEEARMTAEDRLKEIEISLRQSCSTPESQEELLRDMEALMSEKNEAESRLEFELLRRSEFENEVKRATEEEKQILMNEAEEKINLLKDEISQLKSDLSHVESELYNMKDENDDLHDKINRAESKIEDTKGTISSLRDELNHQTELKEILQQNFDRLHNESINFKSQVLTAKASFEAESHNKVKNVENKLSDALSKLALSQREVEVHNLTIADLTNELNQYKKRLTSMKDMASNENCIEASKLREELMSVKIELSSINSEFLSAKNEVVALKEKISLVKKREHEKQQALAQKAKCSIEQLQEQLKKAEEKTKETVHCLTSSDTEIKVLQSQLEGLKSTLEQKDVRIQKLEKSKMTKDQVEKIRKMQEERVKFMTEAKDYKQRIEELEKEIVQGETGAKTRRYALRERKDSPKKNEQQDISRLNDELKQCNLKLRKYVQHCERLDKERNGVMAAISSCNAEDIIGNSLEEIVTSLCEKFLNIKEECDALGKSEAKACEYLAELDCLHNKHAKLESDLQQYKDSNNELSRANADCKSSLKKAHDRIAILMKENESLQASQASTTGNISELQQEQRRQMQYLENENLQLGDELKRIKKELMDTKVVLDAAQKNVFSNEATEELAGINSLLEPPFMQDAYASPSKHASFESTWKKPLLVSAKKIPLATLSQNYNNKENNFQLQMQSEHISSPDHSSIKRRSVNPFSSVKKATRRTKKALSDNSPKHFALGEESEHTGEMTSECKQS